MSNLLKLRRRIKLRKPNYFRLQWWKVISQKNNKDSWRRPRGIHSKVRRRLKGRHKMVEVGYGSPKVVRNLLPNGKMGRLVYNTMDLEKIDKDRESAIIARTVGKKKRQEIINRAKELNIEVFNI
ncbi:50S ribosomal protein L32e [Nanobdella aerobiophila]|uniref:Large ribosomal subunit protein eL32 n=1 Tax=Nanobdella aerobiophila TaxID=2586965 RepID=A0A915SYG8_9ARCH|nr:50S ribosomal protein L32e [Nanobdella aerobiophila]BBL45800.1 50S ribosomal protein L32e [Nanobdella aerobiophila]